MEVSDQLHVPATTPSVTLKLDLMCLQVLLYIVVKRGDTW
jgi:hypothetical protein